jgi:very-short-patch-repair endonuclease
MGRRPRIPGSLMRQPFTLAQARAAGISRKHLSGKSWKRLARGLYCWTGWRTDPWQLINGWKQLLPDDAIFAGLTAAWLWGLDVNPIDPVEAIVPADSGLRSRAGLKLRYNRIHHEESGLVRGQRATTLNRTLRDLCAQMAPVEALCVIDMASAAERADSPALVHYADSVRGRPGARRLRQLAQIAAPAESPMETRLRWLLLHAGLERPEGQVDLRDEDGRFVGRADLYYPSERLVIEFDGGTHRARLVEDDRRQNLLINAGFKLLRFTAADLARSEFVPSQVRAALLRAESDVRPVEPDVVGAFFPSQVARRPG